VPGDPGASGYSPGDQAKDKNNSNSGSSTGTKGKYLIPGASEGGTPDTSAPYRPDNRSLRSEKYRQSWPRVSVTRL
jgi:hypothetical protein